MGEVFKAWDPRLERDVAIKLLHPEAAASPDRQKRLLAEGRAASALNHPNILRVYDADVDGASYYLVSEWLEGKSLRDELTRGPLPLKRLLDLAVQIADGLAAAHAIGMVHRDIKPENVMLARDGTARIVDFGLARSEPSTSALSTAEEHATTVSVTGGLSGTPAYMSPEQARGNAGDFRTDQFSFGALVYEMATGAFAFRRDTVADTLSAVLHEEPRPIAEVNPRIPGPLRWVLERCLAKDPAERYAATEDLARELRTMRDHWSESLLGPTATEIAPVRSTRWRTFVAAAVAAIVGAGTVLSLVRLVPADPVPRFTPFASASSYEGSPAWSADGQTLAYVADVDGVLQVFVRRVGDALARQVTQSRFDSERPFWAPNGQQLYFISLAGDQTALWSVGVAGGRPELVLENVEQAAINRDGTHLAVLRGSDSELMLRETLWWSSPPGATPRQELRPPFDRIKATSAEMRFSPDGRLLIGVNAFSAFLPSDASGPSDFYLLKDDVAPPQKVLSHIPRSTTIPSFGWLPDNRHVILALPDVRPGSRHLWLGDTASDDLRPITATHTNESAVAVSPTGERLAYSTDEVDFDLMLIAPDGHTRRPFLATARNEFAPVWSPAGDQFAFVTDRSGSLEIWVRSRDGQWERPIVTAADFGASLTQALGSLAFSPDGRTLAYQRMGEGSFEIWLSPSTGGTPVRLLAASPGQPLYQNGPSWSPDGEWIAYAESDPQQGGVIMKKVRVGTKETVLLIEKLANFSQTAWSPDGRWIVCQTVEAMVRVPVEGGAPTVIGPEPLIEYAWGPDSRTLYALTESETFGHFALVQIDSVTGKVKAINPDLGSIPIANQPIRGLSFLKGQGFLTSLASARSDIWLLEGFQPPRTWLGRLLRRP